MLVEKEEKKQLESFWSASSSWLLHLQRNPSWNYIQSCWGNQLVKSGSVLHTIPLWKAGRCGSWWRWWWWQWAWKWCWWWRSPWCCTCQSPLAQLPPTQCNPTCWVVTINSLWLFRGFTIKADLHGKIRLAWDDMIRSYLHGRKNSQPHAQILFCTPFTKTQPNTLLHQLWSIHII